MEAIHTTPTIASFVPLSTHQSQTPESFFSGPPVLYHHSPAATLKIHASELGTAPALQSLFDPSRAPVNGNSDITAHSQDAEEEYEAEAQGVDIWVSSEYIAAQQDSKNLFADGIKPGGSFSSPLRNKPASQSHTLPFLCTLSKTPPRLRSSSNSLPNLRPSTTMTLTLLSHWL